MKTAARSRRVAFSLIEVVIAMAVTSLCLISVLGLLTVGFTSSQASIEQTGANGIITQITSDLRATAPPTTGQPNVLSSQFSIPIPINPVTTFSTNALYFDGNGVAATNLQPTSAYLATIVFLPNGSNAKTATFAEVKVSWPASAANPVGSVQTFVALDRN